MISIRWRLTILLCLAVGTLFVATGVGVWVAMRELLQSQFDETLTAKARALITASEIDDGDFEIDLTVQDFAGFGKDGNDYFEIRRIDGRLFLSDRAHLVLPYHKLLDRAHEASQQIGTTGRGIGPTYEAKTGRRGLRVADLRDLARARAILTEGIARANQTLQLLGVTDHAWALHRGKRPATNRRASWTGRGREPRSPQLPPLPHPCCPGG